MRLESIQPGNRSITFFSEGGKLRKTMQGAKPPPHALLQTHKKSVRVYTRKPEALEWRGSHPIGCFIFRHSRTQSGSLARTHTKTRGCGNRKITYTYIHTRTWRQKGAICCHCCLFNFAARISSSKRDSQRSSCTPFICISNPWIASFWTSAVTAQNDSRSDRQILVLCYDRLVPVAGSPRKALVINREYSSVQTTDG